MRRPGALVALVALAGVVLAAAAPRSKQVAGLSPQEALRLGERMYRQGLLPSGEPMRAVVQQDIPVDGTMFSCSSCHLRSGVGSIEGTIITLPTNAGWLFQPLRGARMSPTSRGRLPDHLRREEFRPAYTEETLAAALRSGVDPAGRQLNWVMPRYLLKPRDMEVMVFYLTNLSAVPSPGVTDTTISFATVITGEVDPELRQAFEATLRAHITAVNTQSRPHERRAKQGPFYKEEKFTAYRRLVLDVWELEGPPETWRAQLEAHYREKPVFALLSGISTGGWRPIHDFCEDQKIPSLLPITDFPVISESDWYSLYFSKGWYGEGETAARYLAGLAGLAGTRIVQVFRDEPVGRALATGFRETRARLGQSMAHEQVVGPEEVLDRAFWSQLLEPDGDTVLLLWLGRHELDSLAALAAAEDPPTMIFVSGRLLGEELSALPLAARPFTYVTYPYSLPGEKDRAALSVRQWLRSRNIPMTDAKLQGELYFVGWMLSGILKKMRHDFYRDYFLDVVDMMRDQYYAIAPYWRLSFGPSQRYASKGCYVVQVGDGPEPVLIKRSGWVVH